MTNYQKIHLISDIHGYIEGIETIETELSPAEPLFILGDLFNKKYGDEKQLLNKICELSLANKCHVILGNHDEVLFMMFLNTADDQVTHSELTHDTFGVVTESLKGMFSPQFYAEYEQIRLKFKHYQGALSEAVKAYYHAVTQLCKDEKYQPTYEQIKYLYSVTKDYYEVTVGAQQLMLTHSGIPDNCEAIKIVQHDYQPRNDERMLVMGHLSIPYLETFLKQIPRGLPYSSFTKTYQSSLITISGNSKYNTHSNALMIDDGSYTNLVTISAIN
ncbi:metallophosphoesterase [Mollicutes bacterium LVI A0039]|nr:metallophosphoesterase [Mollicutes bacterium LVI A0039]